MSGGAGGVTESLWQCRARRVHPLSSDYFIRCTQPEGHEGPHALDDQGSGDEQTVWSDDSPYALTAAKETRPVTSLVEFRHLGPAAVWFCRCWNYLRHRKLNPATKDRCEECGMVAPHLEVKRDG